MRTKRSMIGDIVMIVIELGWIINDMMIFIIRKLSLEVLVQNDIEW